MQWLELTIQTSSAGIDLLAERLTVIGYDSFIIDDQADLQVSKFVCEYRATRREELTGLLRAAGCSTVQWLFPEETGFYQPIVVAKK